MGQETRERIRLENDRCPSGAETNTLVDPVSNNTSNPEASLGRLIASFAPKTLREENERLLLLKRLGRIRKLKKWLVTCYGLSVHFWLSPPLLGHWMMPTPFFSEEPGTSSIWPE
jgi:hypothetical protein